MRSTLATLTALSALLALPAASLAQADPMLMGDPVDGTGAIIELQPDVPRIEAGPDEDLGTADDVVDFGTLGDVDLVVRTGIMSFPGAVPATAPLRGAVPVAQVGSVPIPFVVAATDGAGAPGNPVVSAAVEGNPVLVVAFPDLDGDGFVGVTGLDGNPNDASTEEAELNLVGRAFAFFQNGQAGGELFVDLGAPVEERVRVVVVAAAYTGATNPGFFGGAVPTGPAVLTNLPFFPRTDPDDVIEGNAPNFADPEGRVGVEVEDEFTPDPSAAYGESFSLATDGSVSSIDVADVQSGPHSHFSFFRVANPATYDEGSDGPLLPGVDALGGRVLLELLRGSLATGSLRLVPTDTFGNSSELLQPVAVELFARAGAQITSPDTDGNPSRETLVVFGAEGVAVTLEGSGPPVVEPLPEPRSALQVLAVLSALAGLRVWRRPPGFRQSSTGDAPGS